MKPASPCGGSKNGSPPSSSMKASSAQSQQSHSSSQSPNSNSRGHSDNGNSREEAPKRKENGNPVTPVKTRDNVSPDISPEQLRREELYDELIFEIIHSVGTDKGSEEENLFRYLQSIFAMDDETHNRSVNRARHQDRPFELNVRVIQGRHLRPSGSDGLSDPFVATRIISKDRRRIIEEFESTRTTTCRERTLNPVWNESFSFDLDGTHEKLRFDVFDFDPAESLRSKIQKLKEIKGIHGTGKFLQELFEQDKKIHELTGWNEISLQSIPPTGQTKWFKILNGFSRPSSESNGEIKLELTFKSGKKNSAAFEEYRQVLRLILDYEIENQNLDPSTWKGALPDTAEAILRQFMVHNGLDVAQVQLAKWVEYTEISVHQPFSNSLFLDILSIIIVYHGKKRYTDEEKELFGSGARRLLESIFKAIAELRTQEEIAPIDILCMVSTLSEFSTLESDRSIDFFSSFTIHPESNIVPENHTILGYTVYFIIQSAIKWFSSLVVKHELRGVTKADLSNVANLIKEVNTDLRRSYHIFDQEFKKIEISYILESYRVYDRKLAELIQPLVDETSKRLYERLGDESAQAEDILLNCNGDESPSSEELDSPVSEEIALSWVYQQLLRFYKFGKNSLPNETEDFQVNTFYEWFGDAITIWIKYLGNKIRQRVKRSTNFDELQPLDHYTNRSTSSVDCVQIIYYMTKGFWEEKAAPDVGDPFYLAEGVLNLLHDVTMFYATEIIKRGTSEPQPEDENRKFFKTAVIINNVMFLHDAIEPLMKEVIGKILLIPESEQTRNIESSVKMSRELINSKIDEVMDMLAHAMGERIKRLIEEETIRHVEHSLLPDHLYSCAAHLEGNFSEENCTKIMRKLWEALCHIIDDITSAFVEKHLPPPVFEYLNGTLDNLVLFFRRYNEDIEHGETYIHVKACLQLHMQTTAELIHHYLLTRVAESKANLLRSFGTLTVMLNIIQPNNGDRKIAIDILNCRNLTPHDRRGTCDPYVTVRFLPEEIFPGAPEFRTEVHMNSLFAIFDESFQVDYPTNEAKVETAIIHFQIMDENLFGSDFVGEVFFPIVDIPYRKGQQLHLTLTKPTNREACPILHTLETRKADKLVRKFLDGERQKMKLTKYQEESE